MLKTKIKAFVTKVRDGFKKSMDKIAMCAMMPLGAIAPKAAEGTATDVSGMIDTIKGFFDDFTVSNLALIIGGALALAVVLFLFWFAYRFIKRAVVKALKKGQI